MALTRAFDRDDLLKAHRSKVRENHQVLHEIFGKTTGIMVAPPSALSIICVLLVGCLTIPVSADEKYLLYDVSPNEGFNLRRDVYLRVARFAKEVGYTLVLPPWGPLPHWKGPSGLMWENFFDIESLNNYTRVIEFRDFMDHFVGDVLIDNVYVLRHAPLTNSIQDSFYTVECGRSVGYRLENGLYEGYFFNEDKVKARNVKCLEVSGVSSVLGSLFTQDSIIMLDHAEVILHEGFGDEEYWRLRKSMVFAKKLQKEADYFIKTRFGDEKFLAVHLRRSDFPIVRPNDVPSIKGAAEQVKKILRERRLKNVFLATDGDDKEVEQFLRLVPETLVYHRSTVRFENSQNLIENTSRDLCDGPDSAKGVAVKGIVPKQCSGNRGDLDKPCRPLDGYCGSVEEDPRLKELSMEEKILPGGGSCLNEGQDRTVSKKAEFPESCGKPELSVGKPSLFQDSCSDGSSNINLEAIEAQAKVLKTSHEKCVNEDQEKGVKARSHVKFEPKCADSRSLDQPCSDNSCPSVFDHPSEPQLAGKSNSKAVEKGTTESPQSCDCSDGTELGMACGGDSCKPGEHADYIEGSFTRCVMR